MTIVGFLTCEANVLKRRYKLVQKVARTPKSAYNHGRFISSLIQHQIKHFHEVEKSLAKPGEPVTDISKLKTELHAGKYLKKMTARLHPQGAEEPKKIAKVTKRRGTARRKPEARKKQGKHKRK
jgi:hypothetical protein